MLVGRSIRRWHWAAIALAIVLGGSVGCRALLTQRAQLVAVSGKITLDGNPVDGARIVFMPIGIKAGNDFSLAYGTSDSVGKYELSLRDQRKGAYTGRYKVLISKSKTNSLRQPNVDPNESPRPWIDQDRVHSPVEDEHSLMDTRMESQKNDWFVEFYNRQTELTIEIDRSTTSANFELKSVDPMLE